MKRLLFIALFLFSNVAYSQHEASEINDPVCNPFIQEYELLFSQRIAKNKLAYEVGVYRVESIDVNGYSKIFYRKFNVVLRKEAGPWRILVDSYAAEKEIIGETDFLSTKKMD